MADFVVTGTGRCGTAHFFNVLNLVGIPGSHETFFQDDRRSFTDADRDAYRRFPTNDVSLFAAPFLGQVGVPSIHLVRDPVATVNSFLHLRLSLTGDHPLCHFIRNWIAPAGETDAEMWLDYWEKWNRLCARAATVTVRVESLSHSGTHDEVIDIVGAPGFVQKWQELPRTRNRVHTIQSSLVPDYLAPRLFVAREEFGY